MKRWFIRSGRQQKKVKKDSASPEKREGWFSVESADVLLATPQRKQLLHTLWQRTSVSRPLFDELYQQPIGRYALLVQQLPASESHHHACPGGLLDHTLEVMAFAAGLRQSYLLPPDGAPEDQARESEAWTATVIYAALLHDAGKVITDIEVSGETGQRWHPWEGTLVHPYRLKYCHSGDYHLHTVAGSLLCLNILPVSALNWLAQYPKLFSLLLYCLSGHYEKAGILGELVQKADMASVAQNMGGDVSQALARPRTSLAGQITTALRELIKDSFTLNNRRGGSDGWLTDDTLWLVSKTAADKTRAWLLQHGISGVPDNNSRLFDEMQSYGLVIPAPDNKAIWHCDIKADGGWTPGGPLTLLRIPPALLWPDASNRPANFAGTVTPVDLPLTADKPEDASTTKPVSGTSGDDLSNVAFSLFTSDSEEDRFIPSTIPGLSVSASPAQEIHKPDLNNAATGNVSATAATTTLSASGFIDWLRQALAARHIAVNDAQARVHMVGGAVFLVSPEIFKLYVTTITGKCDEQWRRIQKDFQKLKLHRRSDEGFNIWTIEVRGPRKTRRVKGYLLDNPSGIFGESVPEDNPYLSVIV